MAASPAADPQAGAGLRRLAAGSATALRSFYREPVTVALLVGLPPLVVNVYGSAMAAFPEMGFVDVEPGTLGQVNGAVFAAAFLAGLVGLFQVVSARGADERLAVAGFPRATLFAARLVAVAGVSVLAAGAAFGVLWLSVRPAAPLAAFGALALAGLLYGLLGMLVGAVVPRELEGSLVLVFVADVDDALASGLLDVDSPVVALLPLHYPHALFEGAVVDGTVAAGDALAALAYLGVVAVVATATYVLVTGERGVGL